MIKIILLSLALVGCTTTGNYSVRHKDVRIDLSTIRATEITIDESCADGTKTTHIKPKPLDLSQCADVLGRIGDLVLP